MCNNAILDLDELLICTCSDIHVYDDTIHVALPWKGRMQCDAQHPDL